ncbi:MAG: hypothetical protein ACYDCH_00680 [Gaiellaceae bacterium]
MKRPAGVYVAVLALASAAPAVATSGSGLHGVVMRGPTRPVCTIGKPCSEPAVGATLVFSRNGRVVARAHVGAAGRYSLRLAPGYYAVSTAAPHQIGWGIRPHAVHVARRMFAHLDFSIDTGIR